MGTGTCTGLPKDGAESTDRYSRALTAPTFSPIVKPATFEPMLSGAKVGGLGMPIFAAAACSAGVPSPSRT
eukprot:4334627-Pleurochrysis_carterae.AAC.1